MSWQHRARLLIGMAAVAFAVVLAFAFRGRPASDAPPPVVPSDPEALVETAGGVTFRIDRDEEQMRITYQRLLQYADGRTRMSGVTVIADRGEVTYEIKADEGEAADDESSVELVGNVRLTSTDGLVMEAERATYLRIDGRIRAPGPVAFSKGRTSGTSVGLEYDVNQEYLYLLEQAVVRVAGDEGADAMEIASGSAEFRRPDGVILFRGSLEGTREGQRIVADEGTAHLAGENDYLQQLLLRGGSSITGVSPTPGGLELMAARDIDLDYRDDGQTLDEAALVQDAEIRMAGDEPGQGRRINANRIELATTADGSAPRSLDAGGQVRMQLPATQGGAVRTITAETFLGDGDETQGITSGRFSGDVLYQERTGDSARTAESQTLDVSLAPGMGDVEEARFDGGVRFEKGAMTAVADRAVYQVNADRLDLRGDTGSAPPRLVDERITVEARSIDVGFEGPQIAAEGAVKSELRPEPAGADGSKSASTRRPSLLDADKPVLVLANALQYDGGEGRATYTGNAWLSQGDTSIKSDSLVLDEKTGDLAADGSVFTTTILEQVTAEGERRRVHSVARAASFRYEEADRRATYDGNAQVGGPQGDMQARLIELFLKPSGNELERVEAYDDVTLIEAARRTTGQRLTYFSEDQRYLVIGAPVRVVDGPESCRNETTGRTLTFFQNADRVIVDGNPQVRTRTTGSTQCP